VEVASARRPAPDTKSLICRERRYGSYSSLSHLSGGLAKAMMNQVCFGRPEYNGNHNRTQQLSQSQHTHAHTHDCVKNKKERDIRGGGRGPSIDALMFLQQIIDGISRMIGESGENAREFGRIQLKHIAEDLHGQLQATIPLDMTTRLEIPSRLPAISRRRSRESACSRLVAPPPCSSSPPSSCPPSAGACNGGCQSSPTTSRHML
jgi:hypothetical protein